MYMIVRFYWQHDLDLIALCKHPDFDMQAWMKRAIIAYVRGTPLSIPNPPSQPYSVDLTDCSIHLTFSPYTEADVIEALTGFRLGFRNSAVKILFRHYLEKARLDPFYNDSTYRIKSRRKKRKSGGRKRREKPNTGTKGIGPDTDTSKEQKQQEVAAAQTSEPMKSKRSAHKTDSTNIRETEAEQRREPHIPEPIAKQEAHPRQESPDTEQRVEEVLHQHNIYYAKSEVWIESEKLYEVLYILPSNLTPNDIRRTEYFKTKSQKRGELDRKTSGKIVDEIGNC